MKEENKLSKRTNVSINPDVLWRLDMMAETNGVSRSALISVLVTREWNDYVDSMTKNQQFVEFVTAKKG